MSETYRPPKAAQAEGLNGPLTLAEVARLRDNWPGAEGRAWAATICERVEERAAVIDGSPMDDSLTGEVSELLADVVSLYFRAHAAHWNVVGASFAQYHELFADIYADVYASIDPLAENLRKLGAAAPTGLAQVVATRSLQDTDPGRDPQGLAADLLAANDAVIAELGEVFTAATAAGQQGLANFLADRIDRHQTWRWQLSASLGDEVGPEPVEDEETETDEPADMEGRRAGLAAADKVTTATEVRAMSTDDGACRIGGYAAMFDTEADGLSFREQIKPGAFRAALASGDPVYFLINHDDAGLPLASTASGTLRVWEDERGLAFEVDLDPENPDAKSLYSAVSRGDVQHMSFAMTVDPDGQEQVDGVRNVTNVRKLWEVSAVTWPAYSASSVAPRSADADDPDLALRWAWQTARLKSRRS